MVRRTEVLAMAALLVVTAAGAPLVAAAAPGGDGGENANTTAPGARLAGVVGVGQAELEGNVESRALDNRLSKADSAAAKAAVVGGSVSELRERLQTLHETRQRLVEAHQNGTMPTSEFRARMASLSARVTTVSQQLNVTAETARGLPDDVLREKGVNVSAIETLRTSARNLSGPEVADIARSITGKTSPPGAAGSGGADAAVSAAARQVEQARSAVQEAANRSETPEGLDAARTHLEAAEAALEDAREAKADGDVSAAREAASEARTEARAALKALRGGGSPPGGSDDPGGDRGRNETGKPDDAGQ